MVTFDDLAGGFVNGGVGVDYDGVVVDNGVAFAERFKGQTLSYNGNFDVLSGNPTGPLTLVAGAPNQNLNIFTEISSNVLAPDGPVGYPNDDGIGEGAVSFLFSTDQSQFGFQLVGGNGGDATVSFYANDGSLLQSITLTNLSSAAYGFETDGGLKDVRGVSITNVDPYGIALDNLKYDVPSDIGAGPPTGANGGVPEPASWALMLLGFGGLGATLRSARRRGALMA
ncbi:MAG: PEP-CTERM sorting domain-containing protein [Phenylobacterium sp.]|nr:MAG: PEP-CTERM sorting domain-containing protein [Phenylobacterium sp.]